MAADFTQEKTWKARRARSILRLVAKFHKQKANKEQKEHNKRIAERKRLANKVARDIKKYWIKIDKIVAYKVKLEMEVARKSVMDAHLRFLIGQTEKYTKALMTSFHECNQQTMNNNVHSVKSQPRLNGEIVVEREDDVEQEMINADWERNGIKKENIVNHIKNENGSVEPSDSVYVEDSKSSNDQNGMTIEKLEELYAAKHSAVHQLDSDDCSEYSRCSDLSEDDETTLEQEENKPCLESNELEMENLNADNELTVEELRRRYYGTSENDHAANTSDFKKDKDNGSDASSEYSMLSESEDDEATLDQEARNLPLESAEDELAQLEMDNELSVEQLRLRYQNMDSSSHAVPMDCSDDESKNSAKKATPSNMIDLASVDEDDDSKVDVQDITSVNSNSDEISSNGSIIHSETSCDKMDSLQTSITNGNTISSMGHPYLLSNSLKLRLYQQIGLDWLASMYHRRMNGILADEMGLGKTIQTISLLAYLAANMGIWGPHLIVVPTSCLLNWEMECKRWAPGFKVLSYYGTVKRRKELRQGWARPNSFHICITSYQLVVQDASCFKRKKWYYLILDEAHHIKNWKSLRWQTLLTFNSHRRLLLTGTPLQNNIMELWALMHFLMPHVFRSRKEFTYWFHTPLDAMIEDGDKNQELILRLHRIIRPFVLRRLKKDVEKQLPGKFEHRIVCYLSKRQRILYEEFMARSSTRKTLSKGNFLGMLNVLMQLRKVCNHPDLFEPRPIKTPFDFHQIQYDYPGQLLLKRGPTVNFQQRCAFRIQEIQLTTWPAIDRPVVCRTEFDAPDVQNLGKIRAENEYLRVLQNRKRIRHMNALKCNVLVHQVWNFDIADALLIEDINLGPYVDLCDTCPGISRKVPQPLISLVTEPRAPFIEKILHLAPVLGCVVPKARAVGIHCMPENAAANHFVKRYLYEPGTKESYAMLKQQSLCFPEKRLIQYDCGKLQALDLLLRKLKHGKHRCLIFTQMSSMLNILEIFLNIHGHTYFRLDGATPVEKRQYLMDRFNKDDKVFCFILSTRSGGLGINLTGADAVIFYDSDWNPAMDAQAQDRAHRIGQTREVHIYRLITESTIEENIIRKAEQKQQLDIMVLAEGNFNTEFLSKSSIREIVGENAMTDGDAAANDNEAISSKEVESAMASLEDAEDVQAMQKAKNEIDAEEKEFDDVAPESSIPDATDIEKDQERQLAEWKKSVSLNHFEDSLRPVDQYSLHFRQTVDPLMHWVPIDANAAPALAEIELEIEEIEAEKIAQEHVQLLNGDLAVAKDYFPLENCKLEDDKDYFHTERRRFRRIQKHRVITGEAWEVRMDNKYQHPFYYNLDTHEAVWEKPLVLIRRDEQRLALKLGYTGLRDTLLLHICSYLMPYPDQYQVRFVCKSWHKAATHPSLWYHVKSCISSNDGAFCQEINESDLQYQLQHRQLLRGETLYLPNGRYWIHENIALSTSIRLLGESMDDTEIILQHHNLTWAASGRIENLAIRRIALGESHRSSLKPALCRSILSFTLPNSTIQLSKCHLHGSWKGLSCIYATGIHHLELVDSIIEKAGRSGIFAIGSNLIVFDCKIRSNKSCGMSLLFTNLSMRATHISKNRHFALRLFESTLARLVSNSFSHNQKGVIDFDRNEIDDFDSSMQETIAID